MSVSDRLAKVKSRLAVYYAAEIAILGGQEYRIGTRSLARADLAEVREAISDLEAVEDELNLQVAGRGRRWAGRIIPRDL